MITNRCMFVSQSHFIEWDNDVAGDRNDQRGQEGSDEELARQALVRKDLNRVLSSSATSFTAVESSATFRHRVTENYYSLDRASRGPCIKEGRCHHRSFVLWQQRSQCVLMTHGRTCWWRHHTYTDGYWQWLVMTVTITPTDVMRPISGSIDGWHIGSLSLFSGTRCHGHAKHACDWLTEDCGLDKGPTRESAQAGRTDVNIPTTIMLPRRQT